MKICEKTFSDNCTVGIQKPTLTPTIEILNPMKIEPIRLCGACYGESSYHRLEWQFKSVWKCDHHQLKLLSKYPQCEAKFKIPSL